MVRMFTAETPLQGRPLLSIGAHAYLPGQLLGTEEASGCRSVAESGVPGNRW